MKTRSFLVISGPGMNLLGTRKTSIYGEGSLEDIHRGLRARAEELGVAVDCRQFNGEGAIIDVEHIKPLPVSIDMPLPGHTSPALGDKALTRLYADNHAAAVKGELNLGPNGLGYLVLGSYMPDARAMYCPSAGGTMPLPRSRDGWTTNTFDGATSMSHLQRAGPTMYPRGQLGSRQRQVFAAERRAMRVTRRLDAKQQSDRQRDLRCGRREMPGHRPGAA